nr:transcription factor E2FB isoform X2 [Tanacetum cinerariifolium]
SNADYWFISDADVSITDIWRTESSVQWNNMGILKDDYPMPGVATAHDQTLKSDHLQVHSDENKS